MPRTGSFAVKPAVMALVLISSTPYTHVYGSGDQCTTPKNLCEKLRQESPEFKTNLGFPVSNKEPLSVPRTLHLFPKSLTHLVLVWEA